MYVYPGIYTPSYKILVSIGNNKDWHYNDVGLLDEVFKNYRFSHDLGEYKQAKLILQFTMKHSYRLNITKWNPKKSYNLYKKLNKS